MILPRLQAGLFACSRAAIQNSGLSLHSQSLLQGSRRFANIGGRAGRGNRTGTINPGLRAQEKAPTRSLKEILLSPTSGAPFSIGSSAVAGAAVFGLGALCYYGLGMSSEAGIYEETFAWPQYVRDRVHSTYMYFGTGLGLTAGAAAAAFRSPAIMRMMTRSGWIPLLLTMGAMIGTSAIARSIPYEAGTFGTKQLAWALHCGVVGAVIAPLCILGGPLMLRAAFFTAGIAASLSAIAYCAPSDKFLNMAGPLAIGLGVVFAASVGSMFLPPTTALGAGIYSIALYGGLLLFSAFLLYDTQKIVKKAQVHPQYSMTQFDPVNASMSIYMDVINIFVRIVTILAGGGGRKK